MHATRGFAAALVLLVWAAPARPVGAAPDPGGEEARFKIVGYLPSWQGDPEKIALGRLTHVNYAFVLPTKAGAIAPFNHAAKLGATVRAARAKGVKVLIAIGGWNDGDDSAFEAIAQKPALRAKLVKNVVAFVEEHGLDGVDLDWEYPEEGASARGFLALVRELRAALVPQRLLLTLAVVGQGPRGAAIP
jgi:GH18 family chitinase